jgi:ABC-type Fe3+/spermidine/putrescine transport system ATPase subunit
MARALADRIAVLRDGTIVQAGTPRALYDHPADLLVAACLGEINRLPGTLRAVEDGIAEVALDAGPVVEAAIGDVAEPGSRCEILIRPERVALAAASAAELGAGAIPAVIRAIRDHGDHVVVTVAVGGSRLVVRRPSAAGLAIGRNVAIAWQAPHASACRPAAANEPGTAALPHTQASFRVGAAEIADTN